MPFNGIVVRFNGNDLISRMGVNMGRKHVNALELVNGFETQSHQYRRQWTNWLGIGSAGGILALLSFAAQLPEPDFALRILGPGLAAFTVGVVTAAPNLLFAAFESSAAASHIADAANRDNIKTEIDKIPEAIASPPELADRMNAPRNRLIAEHDDYHVRAEAEWSKRTRWRWAMRITSSISACAFMVGISFPLYAVLTGTNFVPSGG